MAQASGTSDNDLTGFVSIIASYEHRVGHACRAVASHIPALLTGLPSKPVLFDNACGTGAASEEIIKMLPSARIYAADVVPPMVQAMKAIVAQKPELQKSVVEVEIMDGQALRYAEDFFDVIITNFGIFFFPNPAVGVQEVYRTLKPGGSAVFTLWRDFGFKPILWEAQKRIKPANPLTELPLMEPWCDGKLLKQTLQEGGFTSIEMTSVTEGMWGSGRKDLESVLLENCQAMVARNWTDEEKLKLPAVTTQVLDDHEAEFCIKSGDKKIGVPMTAWIAVCKK